MKNITLIRAPKIKMIHDVTAKATFQLGDPENDFTVLAGGLEINQQKSENLRKIYESLSGKKVKISQAWVRIEGTTKDDFNKFLKNHDELHGGDIDIYDFGSGIVACVDIKSLIQHFRMPDMLNPENFKGFVGEKLDGDTHIRLRLSSGIGVNHAMEVQLKEGVNMFATFLENLTCHLDLQFQKKTFDVVWRMYGKLVEELVDEMFRFKEEVKKLIQAPLQYLESIQLNFKLASWRALPELMTRSTKEHGLKGVIKEILGREEVNKIF